MKVVVYFVGSMQLLGKSDLQPMTLLGNEMQLVQLPLSITVTVTLNNIILTIKKNALFVLKKDITVTAASQTMRVRKQLSVCFLWNEKWTVCNIIIL